VHVSSRWATALLASAALAPGLGTAVIENSAASPTASAEASSATVPVVKQHLTPSSAVLKKCMPKAKVKIKVELKTDAVGFDEFNISAKGLPKYTPFTVFLLEQADSPFGAAEYIGDITTDNKGRASNQYKLIVEEAFSSPLVNGQRVRKELNQVGMWFADPAGDDFCFGKGKGPITPFDGDDEAGVQAFNSRYTAPLP
jgi:hypothetical protein